LILIGAVPAACLGLREKGYGENIFYTQTEDKTRPYSIKMLSRPEGVSPSQWEVMRAKLAAGGHYDIITAVATNGKTFFLKKGHNLA